MKTKLLITSLFSIVLGFSKAHSQTIQSTNFQNEYQTFLENQKTPFLLGNEEFFVLDGLAWERLYGEKEYVLTPTIQDISLYDKRINNDSKFHFISLDITELSKALLSNMGINIPAYSLNNVNAYLPEIDIDILKQNNIIFKYLPDYGNQKFSGGQIPTPQAIIWSDGFETVFPSTNYTTNILGSANCGWDDVSCAYHSGSWSLWCASIGAACNACGGSTVSDMGSTFYKTTSINTTAYMDLWFKYWKWQDLNDAELTDALYRYTNLGSGWVLSATFLSNDADDEAGWLQKTVFYSGVFPSFNVQFKYYSDGSWNADGIYLDDFELSGTINGVEDINLNNSISINPNPSNGIFSVMQSDKAEKLNLSISNIIGEKVFETKIFSVSTQIDLSNHPNGIYFIQINSNKGSATKKLVINK